jgi:hypothetical protein
MAIRRPAFGEAERRPAGAKPGVSPTIPPEVAESVSNRIKGGSLVYIHAGGKRCAAEKSRRAVKHSKERTGRVEGRHNACSLLYPYLRTKAVLGARGESPLESGRNSQWGSDMPVVKIWIRRGTPAPGELDFESVKNTKSEGNTSLLYAKR